MIYLDNAATTKPCEAAVKAMFQAVEDFANPSSLHGAGYNVEKLVEGSRDKLAKSLGVDKKNIYFTSGGTEANNLAILGTAEALKRRGTRVVTSKIEHPSVLEAFKELERREFDVVYVGVDKDGRILLDELCDSLTDTTILVSIMHVNNETGVIEPIEEIAKIVREKCPHCVIHSDCVQSFGKIPVKPSNMDVDMVSISAHKIHGFKGVGALYTRNRHIASLLYGGEQQNGLRPGTENTGGIFAFGAASEECDCDNSDLVEKRAFMRDALLKEIDNVRINGSDEYNSGSVLNVSFVGIKAEILLHSLERHNIYVSTGSACSSHKPQPSHVLTAMGLNQKEIEGAIRISFSKATTKEEIMFSVEKIRDEVNTIRRYVR